ncbi:hypothetical protein LCGC14_2434400 [marine sediment metagenome]|uniref:Uncharacterized protein n=1 Tax=marine sediment metagenome TaxID=412755 RepID=A0A0F9C8A2_9ZZZZ
MEKDNTTTKPITTEQKYYRILQAMLHGRRRLKSEERIALRFACTLISQRVGEMELDED